MSKRTYKYILLPIAIFTVAGLSMLVFNQNESSLVSPSKTAIKSLPHPTLADWQIGEQGNLEVIYQTNRKNIAFSANKSSSIPLSKREKAITSDRYALFYTVHDSDNYIDASIDMRKREIKIEGLNPAEKIHLEFDGIKHSEVSSDWAGKITVSFNRINLLNTDHLCLSFTESSLGFCHRLIQNTVNKEEVLG